MIPMLLEASSVGLDIPAVLQDILAMGTSMFEFAIGNPVMRIFLVGSLVPIGFVVFKGLKSIFSPSVG